MLALIHCHCYQYKALIIPVFTPGLNVKLRQRRNARYVLASVFQVQNYMSITLCQICFPQRQSKFEMYIISRIW